MQKVLKLALLIKLLYKKPIFALVAMLYNLNKVDFFLKIIFKDINKPKPTIIDKIRKIYIKKKLFKELFKLS